jgi:peptide deformylase
MTIRELRLIGDPILRTASDPVTRFDDALGRLVDDLLENVLLPGRAGLAAPQIGVSLAAFSYYVDGRHGYVINPFIAQTTGEYDGPEACLSVPGVTACTERAMRTVVTGVDRHGDPVVVEGTEEMSRCLLHETDHLRGVLYLDRLSGQPRQDALRQLRRNAGAGAGARFHDGAVNDHRAGRSVRLRP